MGRSLRTERGGHLFEHRRPAEAVAVDHNIGRRVDRVA
jgi:hypothetical protein